MIQQLKYIYKKQENGVRNIIFHAGFKTSEIYLEMSRNKKRENYSKIKCK